MKKQCMSVILALCMVLGVVPLEAFAAESGAFAEPKVTRLVVSYDGGEPVDLLENQPIVSLPVGSKPVFTVTFDSIELLNKVFVTSTKNGEIKYLEAKLQDGKYVTDSYFDPNDTNYIPGTIAVTYSKKTLKIDESSNIGGTDLNTLKTQLTAQGVSSRSEATDADGTVTAEIVLGDTFGGMSGVYFDAAVSEFTAGAGIDQSELNKWLGVYQNLNELSSYDLESADGKQFTLYLGDGRDFSDPDTYLMLVKDATSKKYTKMVLNKAADRVGLGDISDSLASANVVTKKLLEYNAISKDTAALREEVAAHPTMTAQEKAEANAKIDALDCDKKLFLIGMTAISILVPPASAPLMISALVAGYTSIADYFWNYRVGLIQGSDPIDGAFSDDNKHEGGLIPLREEDLNTIWFSNNRGVWVIKNSGKYYAAEPIYASNLSSIDIGDRNGTGTALDVTICMHGNRMSELKVFNGSILHIQDCKEVENNNSVSIREKSKFIMDSGVLLNISSHGGSEVTINDGKIINLLMNFDDGRITINGGQFTAKSSTHGITGSEAGSIVVNDGEICGIDAGGGTLTINGGRILAKNSYSGISNRSGGAVIITNGIIVGGIKTDSSSTTTLLIKGNSDIQVTGTQAFDVTPIVKAGTGYTGGVTYYSSTDAEGIPMTIAEAANIDYTQPYVRLVANGAISGGNITVTPSTGGNVTFTPGEPADGDTVTITVTPDSGYQGGAPVVKDSDGNTIPVTDAGNGKYTFTKPAGQVTITAPEFTRPTYSVTVPASTPNGSVTVSAATVHEGDVVTITVAPNAGYQGGAPVVKDTDGNTLTITDAGNGKYTFVMPARNVVVAAAEFMPMSYTTEFTPMSYIIAGPSKPSNGTVSLSTTTAHKGDIVTITVTPNTGFELDKLTAIDGKGNDLNLRDKGDGKFTFTMPSSKVNIDATFVKIEGTPTQPAAPSISFVDVASNAYYADSVAWAVEKGITVGTNANTFSPNGPCTRTQIVTFLWRAAGSPSPQSGTNPFTDVQPNSYYYDAVLWAVEQGITSGTSATTFSPDATCTRGQSVTFLYRYEKSPAVSGGNAFTDVSSNAYYANAVQWAVTKGVTSGTSATTFSPDAICTRSQIVTFLYRDMA